MSNKIQEKLNLLTKEICKIQTMLIHSLLTWKELSDWAIGESRNIDGTLNYKVWEEDNIMIFKTTIPDGVSFPRHWHNFKEQNYVIEGFYNDASNKASKGEWVKYEELEKHLVENKDKELDLKIMVIFTR